MTRIGVVYRDYMKKKIKKDTRADQEWGELLDWYNLKSD